MWKLKNNPLHCRFALVWLAASVACAGCGSKTPHSDKPWSNVKVTVTAGSQPLEVGQVTLLATEGSTGVDAGGVLDASGRATFPALPGSYVAVIQPLPPPPGGAATDTARAAANEPETAHCLSLLAPRSSRNCSGPADAIQFVVSFATSNA